MCKTNQKVVSQTATVRDTELLAKINYQHRFILTNNEYV